MVDAGVIENGHSFSSITIQIVDISSLKVVSEKLSNYTSICTNSEEIYNLFKYLWE